MTGLEQDAGLNGTGEEWYEAEGFSDSLVTVLDPAGAPAEAYRALRTNLFYAHVDDPPKVIVVTSPGPKEGKSTTCANLGVVLAQADKSTLLVDCDLRRPNMHKFFNLRNFRGVVDVLAHRSRPQEVWHEPLLGLKILTSGVVPPNPAELLGSRRFAEFLVGMSEGFDYVILDAPPVGLVSDPVILATQADGVLLVVNARSTRKGAVRGSMRSLDAVEANVLGTVLNNVDARKTGYYGNGNYTYA